MQWYAMVAAQKYPLEAYLLPSSDGWRVRGEYEGVPITCDGTTITRATAKWRAAAARLADATVLGDALRSTATE